MFVNYKFFKVPGLFFKVPGQFSWLFMDLSQFIRIFKVPGRFSMALHDFRLFFYGSRLVYI